MRIMKTFNRNEVKNLIDFKKLPVSFKKESKALILLNLKTWESIIDLKDSDIRILATQNKGSIRNFNCIRCVSSFICKLNLKQEEAFLLLHSGISNIKALSQTTPEEVKKRTQRLELILGTRRESQVSLHKASLWIKNAKRKLKRADNISKDS